MAKYLRSWYRFPETPGGKTSELPIIVCDDCKDRDRNLVGWERCYGGRLPVRCALCGTIYRELPIVEIGGGEEEWQETEPTSELDNVKRDLLVLIADGADVLSRLLEIVARELGVK
jgi:hypothetical protein